MDLWTICSVHVVFPKMGKKDSIFPLFIPETGLFSYTVKKRLVFPIKANLELKNQIIGKNKFIFTSKSNYLPFSLESL